MPRNDIGYVIPYTILHSWPAFVFHALLHYACLSNLTFFTFAAPLF